MSEPSDSRHEIRQSFRSSAEWRQWLDAHRFVIDPAYIEAIITRIREDGISDPLSGERSPATDIRITGTNYRETIRAGRLISRNRAVLAELKHLAAEQPSLLERRTRIFAPEALTDFALQMRGIYPRFIGSEYASSERERADIFPILHQDLQRLSFASSLFDLIVSNDVFEHIPDLDAALRESGRVLREHGWLLATFPFLRNRESSNRKASIEQGELKLFGEPEVHGNPMQPDAGSLVFEVPAWDLIARAQAAGFSEARYVLHVSAKFGIVSCDVAGVFVFVARKS